MLAQSDCCPHTSAYTVTPRSLSGTLYSTTASTVISTASSDGAQTRSGSKPCVVGGVGGGCCCGSPCGSDGAGARAEELVLAACSDSFCQRSRASSSICLYFGGSLEGTRRDMTRFIAPEPSQVPLPNAVPPPAVSRSCRREAASGDAWESVEPSKVLRLLLLALATPEPGPEAQVTSAMMLADTLARCARARPKAPRKAGSHATCRAAEADSGNFEAGVLRSQCTLDFARRAVQSNP